MESIEDLIINKICSLVNVILSKMIKPDIKIGKISELDTNTIEKLKKDYGIEGTILDVDETIRKNMRSIPKVNQEWIDNLRRQLKIIIVSNGQDKNIEKFFNDMGIEYISCAFKPMKKNFIKACEKMNIEPSKILVVGDSLFDDIYGGKRNEMKTALVKDVEDR